ncbi:MAG TPA: MFS transporter [Candidatus Limnocylindrales bacterium]|nr:MFS transporter [Candidatus Limnocylindrales bacterium]
MLPLRLVVLALGVALGVFYPFIPVILASRGFSPAEIGIVASVGAVGFTLAVPAWGHIADVKLGRSRTLQLCAIAGGAAVGALLGPWPPIVIALLFMAYWVFESSWQPLADALTVNLVDRRSYARVRLLTSLSFAVSSIAAGFLYDSAGFAAAYVLAVVFAVAIAVAAGAVPDIGRAELGRTAERQTPSSRPRPSLGSAGVALRVAPRLGLVLLAVMLINITIISGFTYLPLRLGDLGSPPSDVALSAGVSAIAEIPAMLVAARVAQRIGLRGMFVGSALIYGAATSSWIVLASAEVIIATRLITGVAFAWVLVCVVLTIARLLPSELQATGQSLYQTFGFGFGAIIANVVGGQLYEGIGHGAVFGLGTVLAVVAAAMGWMVFPRDARTRVASSPTPPPSPAT